MTKGTKAYTTPRSFGGFRVPINLQSAAIRSYCDSAGLVFHLHSNEICVADSYVVLESLVDRAKQYEGIAMCSIAMLPTSQQHRLALIDRVLRAGSCLHFIFEQLVVTDHSAMADLEDLRLLIELVSENNPIREHSLLATLQY